MKKQKQKQVKRVLGSIATVVVSGSAVIPVVACSMGDQISNLKAEIGKLDDAFRKSVTTVEKNGLQVNADGSTNLPPAPSGAHWEYRTAGGTFSRQQPSTALPNQEIIIKLVTDDPLNNLAEDVEIATSFHFQSKVVPVGPDTAAALAKIVISPDGSVTNLPDIPHTHLEYSVNRGKDYHPQIPLSPNLFFPLGSEVYIKLVPDENYELSTTNPEIITTIVKTTQEVTIPNSFLTAFQEVYAVEGDVEPVKNVPEALPNTHWEYDLNTGEPDYHPQTIDRESLSPDRFLKMRLVANENYRLSTNVERTNILVKAVNIPTADLAENFTNTTIDVFNGLQNLPPAPAKTFWTYALNDSKNYQRQFPANLIAGDRVKFRLAGGPGVSLTGPELVETTIIVAPGVVDTTGLPGQLAKIPNEINNTVSTLPAAPQYTHWEYQFVSGAATESLPDVTPGGAPVKVKLVPDSPNYELSTPVERSNLLVVPFVQTNDALINALLEVKIFASDDQINGLPPAPEHTFWEYRVISPNGSTSKPYHASAEAFSFHDTGLLPGYQVRITLAPDPYYQLPSGPVERLVTVGKNIVDLDAITENFKSVRENLTAAINEDLLFSRYWEGIGNVPEPPLGTFWEFSMDGGAFSRKPPKIGLEYYTGEKALNLKLRLTTDNGFRDDAFQLSAPFEWSVKATGIVDTAGMEEQMAAASTSWDFPMAPPHSYLLYSRLPYSVPDPDRPNHPITFWLEPEWGWILSEKVVFGYGEDFVTN